MVNNLTPKEAFELGVQMNREKKKKAEQLAKEMQENYQTWLWEQMGIEEVGKW